MYNPLTRVYGEPHRRPEVQNATIEFMAPSEYMVSFLFLFLFFGNNNEKVFALQIEVLAVQA